MEQQFTQLGTGQAFITVLNEKGIPTETVVTHLAPPASFMGPLGDSEYKAHLENSDVYRKYKDAVDPRSAFEMLDEKMQSARKTEAQQQTSSTTSRSRKEKSTLEEVMSSPVSRQIGRELVRGVFGMLFGTRTRRRY